MTVASPSRARVIVGATLLLVYVATLAPGITLWDAGEFASAVESLGIPHPPGTPLYILIARAWRLCLPFVSTALATNLLAAVSTAAAGAIMAGLVAQWTRDTLTAVAAGIAFGVGSTVWLNATETEVYSASLLLSMLMLAIAAGASRANADGPRGPSRGDVALAYLFAIAPALHLSAMVAAPAAIALATVDRELRIDGSRASLLVAAAVLSVGLGTGSPAIALAGVVILIGRLVLSRADLTRAAFETLAIICVVAIGVSTMAFLYYRASLDPAINQGNPTTFAGVIDVIARSQYDVPGLWPRRAPLWLQVGNLFQYVDWQFALGLDRTVGASFLRTPFTPLFLALGVVGSFAHRDHDRRTWATMLILVASATLGVVLYLNLRAGPSYGYGILPPNADREARERDYFFALGFAAFAVWIGYGAVAVARRLAARVKQPSLALAGVAVAALPIALNWNATNRRREPGGTLPAAFARATLESVPSGAVLFVAGDNDTYPLWYAQTASRTRQDVTIVTIPLLGARWYRAELARRYGLYDPVDTLGWRGTSGELTAIAGYAAGAGRPVVAAVAVDASSRAALGSGWIMTGLAYVRDRSGEVSSSPTIDVRAVDSTAAAVSRLFPGVVDPERVDEPAARYLTSLLMCPTLAKDAAKGTAADSARLLASRCNFR